MAGPQTGRRTGKSSTSRTVKRSSCRSRSSLRSLREREESARARRVSFSPVSKFRNAPSLSSLSSSVLGPFPSLLFRLRIDPDLAFFVEVRRQIDFVGFPLSFPRGISRSPLFCSFWPPFLLFAPFRPRIDEGCRGGEMENRARGELGLRPG